MGRMSLFGVPGSVLIRTTLLNHCRGVAVSTQTKQDSGARYADLPQSQGELVKRKVYPGRFYVLMVLSFVAIQRNVAWLTFGTIPNESFTHFKLSNEEITLLSAYGPIVFIPLTLPFMWFLQRFGMRVTVLINVWILAIGCTIRIFVPDGRQWVFLLHIGHILIAAVGPLVMIAPPRLSVLWFPPRQRTLATAVSAMSQQVGVALGFLIIPYLTRRYDIHTMLYVQAEMGIFVLLYTSLLSHPLYQVFPLELQESTLSPPSRLLYVIRPSSYWLGFSSILSIILNSSSGYHDIVPVTSINEFFHSNAWLGAFSAMAGAVGGQIAALLADRVQRRFKVILLVLLIGATVFAFWFSVSVYGYITDNAVNKFLSLCLQYFFAIAATPIYYEAAVEATYPVPEGSSSGCLMMLANFSVLTLQLCRFCMLWNVTTSYSGGVVNLYDSVYTGRLTPSLEKQMAEIYSPVVKDGMLAVTMVPFQQQVG